MSHLQIDQRGGARWITLNRPSLHNAFNEALIAELSAAFEALEDDPGVRCVVLAGAGRSFCAGADLNWMRSLVGHNEAQNREDSLALAGLFGRIDRCKKPVVARVQGAAIGGGCGLVAVCDIVVAGPRARFATSEVRLGLAPAVIAPYVVRKIGTSRARDLFLTARRLKPAEALSVGLCHRLCEDEGDLDAAVAAVTAQLGQGGPEALAACKRLGREADLWEAPEAKTAAIIAALRVGEEGQEGMRAFLEKRPPAYALRAEAD